MLNRREEAESQYRRHVLQGLGWEFAGDRESNVDGPGNDAWQRAQAIAARMDANRRRN